MAKPTEIKLHQKSRVLEIHFDDGFTCNLTCEYLRVFSPSAEVQGHGPGQAVLQIGKEDVSITGIEQMGKNYESNWADYLQRLQAAGVSRRTD